MVAMHNAGDLFPLDFFWQMSRDVIPVRKATPGGLKGDLFCRCDAVAGQGTRRNVPRDENRRDGNFGASATVIGTIPTGALPSAEISAVIHQA